MDRAPGPPAKGGERLAKDAHQEVVHAAARALDVFRAGRGQEGGDADSPVAAQLRVVARHLELKEHERALRAANQALADARDARSKLAEVDVLLAMAQVHSAMRRPEEAAEGIADAVAVCERMDDRKAAAGCLAKLANALLDLGRPEQALDVAEAARERYGRILDGRGQAELFRGLVAAAHWRRGDHDQALAATEAALELFRILGDRSEQASTLYALAKLRRDAGRKEDALHAGAELVALCAGSGGTPAAEADARHMVAHLHLLAGEHEEALLRADEALALFRKLGDQRGEAAVLETVMRLRVAQGDVEAAQRAAEEVQAACLAAGDRPRAAQAAQAITNMRVFKQEFREVLEAAKSAREACREQGDAHGEAQQWLATATARLEQVRVATVPAAGAQAPFPTRRVMEALMAAKEALHLFRGLGDPAGQAAALQALAKARRLKGEPTLALEAAREAVTVCRALEDAHGTAQALLLEATTQLVTVGTAWEAPEEEEQDLLAQGGGTPFRSAAAAAAASLAEEALELCRGLQDDELERYAQKVLEAARACLTAPPATGAQPREEVLAAIDPAERGPLEDMGFCFKSQAEAAELLRLDPRLEAVLRQRLPEVPLVPSAAAAPGPDPAMDRLLAFARQAVPARAH